MQYNGSGSAIAPGTVPILVGGKRYRCPKCGNEPPNTQPGIPEAMMTVVKGEASPVFLCVPCFQAWQIAEYRANVPALEIKED